MTGDQVAYLLVTLALFVITTTVALALYVRSERRRK